MMEKDLIPVFKPLLGEEELQACAEALKLGWLGQGSYVNRFEEEVGEFLHARDRFTVALSTGHAALHLGLLAMGVGPGDEVITPSLNNVADFQAIRATGANIVFCDVFDDTLCIDPEKVAGLITKQTKAMIVTDYACHLCDHDRIGDLAQKHHIRVLHDAAHSFGSRYRNQVLGSFSDMTMFSFDPVKNITCIDGGMLVVKSEKERDNIREMRLLGMKKVSYALSQNQSSATQDVEVPGFRYHLANLHAAVGIAQLKKFSHIAHSRRETCRFYQRELKKNPEIKIPKTDFEDIVPFIFYIRLENGKREKLREFLHKRGVETGIHWIPGHQFTLFKDQRRGDLSVTERVAKEILTIPLHPMMVEQDRDRVVEGINSFFRA